MQPLRWEHRPDGLLAPALVCAFKGWHDAADLLKYLLTSGNATAQMLLAYQLDSTKAHSRTRLAADIFDEDKAKDGLKKIATLLSAKTMSELPKQLLDSSAVQEVQYLFTLLKDHGVTNAVFDISLMRGFDYYTGIVFEVFDNHPDNRRAMFGGGRYDGLVGLFGVDPIPTVGMAPGATTMEDFLRSHELLPTFDSTTEVYMVVLGSALKGAQKLAMKLRNEGVNVEVDITGRKLDKQIKTAIKKKIPFMLFVGEKELSEEVYPLKDVAKEQEQKLSIERVIVEIKDYRNDDDL